MCEFTMQPGSTEEAPAQWGGPITLTATQAAAFAPGPDVNPANEVALVCGTTRTPLTVTLWAPDVITALLPSEPSDCQQPHVSVTSGVAGAEQTCTQPLFVGALGGPTEAAVGDSLEQVISRLAVELAPGTLPPGDPVRARLEKQANGGGGATVVRPGGTVVAPAVTEVTRGGAAPSGPRLPGVVRVPGLADDITIARPGESSGSGGPRRPGVHETTAPGSGEVFVDDESGGEPFSDPSLPVPTTIKVRWEVLDEQGGARQAGDDFEVRRAPGQSIREPDLLVAPPIAEFGSAAASVATTNHVVAHVVLTATMPDGRQVSRSGSTAPVPLALLPIGMPTVAGFFRHDNFRNPIPVEDGGSLSFDSSNAGAVVVALPPDSAISEGDVKPLLRVLGDVRDVMRRLRTLASIAELLVGVELLSDALAEQVLFAVRVRSSVDDMHDIIWQEEEFATVDLLDPDLRAEDRVTSMVLLGLAGRRVDAFQHDGFGGMRVTMEVTAPAGWIALRDLREKATFKSDAVGARVDRSHPGKDFNDRMSSYRWT